MKAEPDLRMFPAGAPLSPSGRVVMGTCGRRPMIRSSKRGECTWCGAEVKPPRRTWCSAACVEEFRRRVPSNLRSRILARDKGQPCPLCDVTRFSPEVDHVVPIVEGGDPFALENLRTICGDCHKGETASLARRRAVARREADAPLLNRTAGQT